MATPKIHILQTCFSHAWGGLEMQALEVSRQLHKRGHRVWFACTSGSTLAEHALKRDLTVVQLKVSGYVHPLIILELRRLIRKEHIDIIHCQHSRDIATLVPAMKVSRRQVPIVLSKRVGSYITKKDVFHQFTYGNVSKVLAISRVIHRNILQTTPVPPDRVMTLHDAIDTESFSLARVVRRRPRSEFGLTDNGVAIGFVGRFSPGKGHEEFLEAAAIIHKQHPAVRFIIVGEASYGEERYEQRIRTISEKLGLRNAVIFAGFRSDIPEVMAAFDIFAFPSHAESFGVALIEAMAMERPVVSTNCDGVLDIVVNGETGLYVHPRDSRQLAEALTRLIENPSLREKMGKAGRKRVEQLFDQKKQLDKLEEIYFELLEMNETQKGHAQAAGIQSPSRL